MDELICRQDVMNVIKNHAFEVLCGQFGIVLPENFVNMPEYEQLMLKDVK